MNRQDKSSAGPILRARLLTDGLALLVLLAWFIATAKGQSLPENSVASSPIHVTNVLGFKNVRRNVSGELSIHADDLTFQGDKTPLHK